MSFAIPSKLIYMWHGIPIAANDTMPFWSLFRCHRMHFLYHFLCDVTEIAASSKRKKHNKNARINDKKKTKMGLKNGVKMRRIKCKWRHFAALRCYAARNCMGKPNRNRTHKRNKKKETRNSSVT